MSKHEDREEEKLFYLFVPFVVSVVSPHIININV